MAYRPDLKDAGVWLEKCPNLERFLDGSDEVLIDARLECREGEPAIRKNMASAFFGTTLSSELIVRGVDSLLVAGTSTSGCVRATVVDGISCGFRMFVVEDCVEDRSPSSHDAALFDIASKYGEVVRLDGAFSMIDQLSAEE